MLPDDILAFADMQEAFEALRSEEGSRARTTKEGFLYTILSFLDEQGLILYVDKEGDDLYDRKTGSVHGLQFAEQKQF